MTRGVRISLGGWEDFPFIWIELYLGGGGGGGAVGKVRQELHSLDLVPMSLWPDRFLKLGEVRSLQQLKLLRTVYCLL